MQFTFRRGWREICGMEQTDGGRKGQRMDGILWQSRHRRHEKLPGRPQEARSGSGKVQASGFGMFNR